MQETIFSLSTGGYHVYFLMLTIISIGLGGVVYGLLRYPQARRPQFRHLGKAPQTIAMTLGLAIALPIFTFAYIDSWQYFFELQLQNGMAVMRYHYPPRTIKLPLKILTIGNETTRRKSQRIYRITFTTPKGHRYKSQSLPPNQGKIHLNQLQTYQAELLTK